MMQDTLVFEGMLLAHVPGLRLMRQAAHHGVMSCGIGVIGRFYNKVRGL